MHRLLELLLPPHAAHLRMLLAADTSGCKQVPPADSPQGKGDATSAAILPAQRASRQLTVFFIFSMKLLSLGEDGLKDRRNPRSDECAHSLRSGISKEGTKWSPTYIGSQEGFRRREIPHQTHVFSLSQAVHLQGVFSARSHGAEEKRAARKSPGAQPWAAGNYYSENCPITAGQVKGPHRAGMREDAFRLTAGARGGKGELPASPPAWQAGSASEPCPQGRVLQA